MNQIDLIQQAMKHISEALDSRINIDTVASQFSYSPSHFHRIFQHVTDMSITDYIRAKRLEHTADLLLDTNRSILEICFMCGFGTSQTFNRLFKATFGQTPAEFRKHGQRRTGLSPERILREYYYRMAKGAHPMLQPYIVERDNFLLIGQRVTLGGSSPSKEGIGWLWENGERIWKEINNKAGDCLYGVSWDFQYGPERGENARHAYMVAAEVTKVEKMAFDHESLVIPASKWIYIPVRYDDLFVKKLAPPEFQDDMGYLSGCVFGWSNLWLKENGWELQGWPMGLEIYNLNQGYEGEGGPQVTIAVPVKKLVLP